MPFKEAFLKGTLPDALQVSQEQMRQALAAYNDNDWFQALPESQQCLIAYIDLSMPLPDDTTEEETVDVQLV